MKEVGGAEELVRLVDASMSVEDWSSVGLSAIVSLVGRVDVPLRINEEKV